ncbi:hypothetical protein GALMADRAFT_225208 [Galerina marginata CBS 339.88]|uniref:Uncharacterized protein n=1 Tax=Galerina marginata (strain CBS 339.88) TaxID=685588 RepID=A0A067T1L5_GALM3|nr:hypothetical protein GALMADRAFT_225208 [Galerina marginata CBS 339.88]
MTVPLLRTMNTYGQAEEITEDMLRELLELETALYGQAAAVDMPTTQAANAPASGLGAVPAVESHLDASGPSRRQQFQAAADRSQARPFFTQRDTFDIDDSNDSDDDVRMIFQVDELKVPQK